MYCTPSELRKAIKPHQCTNCAEMIVVGEEYARWMSIDDGKGYSNKMHIECLESLRKENTGGVFEYDPYCGERPTKETK